MIILLLSKFSSQTNVNKLIFYIYINKVYTNKGGFKHMSKKNVMETKNGIHLEDQHFGTSRHISKENKPDNH